MDKVSMYKEYIYKQAAIPGLSKLISTGIKGLKSGSKILNPAVKGIKQSGVLATKNVGNKMLNLGGKLSGNSNKFVAGIGNTLKSGGLKATANPAGIAKNIATGTALFGGGYALGHKPQEPQVPQTQIQITASSVLDKFYEEKMANIKEQ